MTTVFSAWLTLTFVLGAAATFAVWSRRDTAHRGLSVASFLLAAGVSFFAIQMPLGYPSTREPSPGQYTVLGVRIDVDEAIFVLLDSGQGEPRYFRLPYSTGKADSLQDALNKADGEGGVGLSVGEGGEATFHPPPVVADEPKSEERPVMEVM